MTQQIMKLSELETLLNYKDSRSTKKWCKKNNILIIPMGKQKYVPKKLVEISGTTEERIATILQNI
jgi:hypothetical protein